MFGILLVNGLKKVYLNSNWPDQNLENCPPIERQVTEIMNRYLVGIPVLHGVDHTREAIQSAMHEMSDVFVVDNNGFLVMKCTTPPSASLP